MIWEGGSSTTRTKQHATFLAKEYEQWHNRRTRYFLPGCGVQDKTAP